MGTGGRGGGGGETIVGTTPTGVGRGEGGEAITAVGTATGIHCDEEGRVGKGTVQVVGGALD